MNFYETFETLNKLYENINKLTVSSVMHYKLGDWVKILNYNNPLSKSDNDAANGIIIDIFQNSHNTNPQPYDDTYVDGIAVQILDSRCKDFWAVYDTDESKIKLISNKNTIDEIINAAEEKEKKRGNNINLREYINKTVAEKEKEAQNDTTAQTNIDNSANKAQQKKDNNEQQSNSQKLNTKYSAAQLTNMRKNNGKIIKAAKDAGLDVSSLTTIATDKNGRKFKKASPSLNKMRKELFGEEFEETK